MTGYHHAVSEAESQLSRLTAVVETSGRHDEFVAEAAATEDFAARCLSLPLYPHMPAAERQAVVDAVAKLVRWYAG